MKEDETLIIKIRGLIPTLKPALRSVAQYIVNNPYEIQFKTLKEIADICNVSDATVTRLIKYIGLKNFQELKLLIARLSNDLIKKEKEFVYSDVINGDTIQNIIEKITFTNVSALQETKNILDSTDLEKAILCIENARNINIYCIGVSIIAGLNAKMRFYRIGKNCIVYNDIAAQAVSSTLLKNDDVAIGISNSGSTVSVVNSLKNAKNCGAKTICITNSRESPITKYSDIKLYTATNGSILFQEGMVSRIAQILIIDILYAGLAIKNFNESVEMIEKTAISVKNAIH